MGCGPAGAGFCADTLPQLAQSAAHSATDRTNLGVLMLTGEEHPLFVSVDRLQPRGESPAAELLRHRQDDLVRTGTKLDIDGLRTQRRDPEERRIPRLEGAVAGEHETAVHEQQRERRENSRAASDLTPRLRF